MVFAWKSKWLSPRHCCRRGRLAGPIFEKELRVASRRRRQYALRSLYILVLTVFVGVVWLSVVQYQGNAAYVQSRMAEAGKQIVTTVVFFQFFAMQILAVVLLSSAISDEVYHRTLGILMTTPISSLQIVAGKMLSRLLQLVLLLAISLPLLAIVRVLGGVPWGYLLASLSITLTAAIFAGSVSLRFSIKNRAAYGVILRTLFTLVCLYFVLPALLGVAGLYLMGTFGVLSNRPGGSVSPVVSILLSLNPFSSMIALTGQMLSPAAMKVFSLPLHCGVMLGLSALVLGRAAAVVRQVALRQAAGISEGRLRTAGSGLRAELKSRLLRLAGPGKRQAADSSPVTDRRPGLPRSHRDDMVGSPRSAGLRRVVGPPVVWKELRAPFIQGIDNRNSYIGLAMAIVALVFTYCAGAYAKSLREDYTHVMYALAFLFIGGLINAVFAATRITTEKESQSWPLLLATPLGDGQILLGKAVSAVRRCLPIWGLLAGHVILFTLAGYIHPAAVLHLLMQVAWLTCFLTGAGLYFSARLARTTSAVVATFALATGLWIIGPILAGLASVLGGKNDLLAGYLWTHPAVQTQLIMTGAGGWQNAGAPWRSLSYATRSLFHCGPETMGVGQVTGILAAIAGAYILAGLVFFWRAGCRLRRKVF
jgi:ABC-type transport system involved in multi-copper enzyme maturation permease subunit